jgi:hypothetical protein
MSLRISETPEYTPGADAEESEEINRDADDLEDDAEGIEDDREIEEEDTPEASTACSRNANMQNRPCCQADA